MRKHYYLVSGEVFYRDPSAEEGTVIGGSVKMNSLLALERNRVTAKDMGKAQQALQLRFHNQMQDPTLEVFDVFLFSTSYLGHMTDEEFSKDVVEMSQPGTKEEDTGKPFTLPGLGQPKGVFDA